MLLSGCVHTKSDAAAKAHSLSPFISKGTPCATAVIAIDASGDNFCLAPEVEPGLTFWLPITSLGQVFFN